MKTVSDLDAGIGIGQILTGWDSDSADVIHSDRGHTPNGPTQMLGSRLLIES
jgi:hypothetical protein